MNVIFDAGKFSWWWKLEVFKGAMIIIISISWGLTLCARHYRCSLCILSHGNLKKPTKFVSHALMDDKTRHIAGKWLSLAMSPGNFIPSWHAWNTMLFSLSKYYWSVNWINMTVMYKEGELMGPLLYFAYQNTH